MQNLPGIRKKINLKLFSSSFLTCFSLLTVMFRRVHHKVIKFNLSPSEDIHRHHSSNTFLFVDFHVWCASDWTGS